MKLSIPVNSLREHGMSDVAAHELLKQLEALPDLAPAAAWTTVSKTILTRAVPFAVHQLLFDALFDGWDHRQAPPPAWSPDDSRIANANITEMREALGLDTFAEFYEWSHTHRARFWHAVTDRLGIVFADPPSKILDLQNSVENPRWFPGASLNISASCFRAPKHASAIVYQRGGGPMQTMTYGDLDALSNRVANGLTEAGYGKGTPIAIAMPMTVEAVSAYLGIVKAGGVVVSIADSFSPEEIATRLRIAGTKTVITQDVILRGNKTIAMYDRVVDAGAPRTWVIPASGELRIKLRDGDGAWADLLSGDKAFEPVVCRPDDPINVLFSSGTTGEPKAIPWNQTTPIKCAMDGHLHQDIQPGHVVAWPTNLGWMMGPWLIFAALINRATMALFDGSPGTFEFCKFVQDARVQMLGVVPSLVKAWRTADVPDGLDWSAVQVFSSTGEASNANDYLYLMSLANYCPIIEYCGGTEIGGGYISGTVVQAASPATFSTPSLGLDLCLLDDDGRPSNAGEVFLIPPSIGFSTTLLNRDHHEVYFVDAPSGPRGEVLRRHGDQMERLGGGYYRAHGRADDTMNLSGIKTSSAEIERAVATVEGVVETAAIAVAPPGGGPSRLVIYAVIDGAVEPNGSVLRRRMQQAIARNLNPLFKLYDVVVIDSLPRTASNKVMRRVLRDRFVDGS